MSGSSGVGGWLRLLLLLAVAVAVLIGLRVLRAERGHPPVPTQRDLQEHNGLPVEVAAVRRGQLTRPVRVFGTVEGRQQAEIVVPTPNVLEQLYVEVGDAVRSGQQLARMRSVALSPLGFRLEPLRAQHDAAQADLARVEAMHAEGGVTDQQLEHARAQARAAASDYEAAVAAVHITAPIDGVVTRIDFRRGEMVPNDRPLLQIAELDTVAVELMVEAADVAEIAAGQAVSVTSAARPGETFAGAVVERAMGAYPVINQFRVRVEVPNPDHRLLPGYPAQAEVSVRSADDALIVPLEAIVEREGRGAVWRVGDGDLAELRPVDAGVDDGADVAVTGDLAVGDRVVTLGSSRVSGEGTRLIVVD